MFCKEGGEYFHFLFLLHISFGDLKVKYEDFFIVQKHLQSQPILLVKTSTYKFVLKSCMFGVTYMAKKSDKSKWVCSGYGVAFDGKSELDFDNLLGML